MALPLGKKRLLTTVTICTQQPPTTLEDVLMAWYTLGLTLTSMEKWQLKCHNEVPDRQNSKVYTLSHVLSSLGVNKGSIGVRLFARLPVHHILMFSRIHFSNHSRSLVNVNEITQITCHNMCHNTIMCGTLTQGRHSLPRQN